MQERHKFPPEIQKWIVAKKIARDDETLHKLRLKDGSSMFLYLLSPKSVGIKKENYRRSPEESMYICDNLKTIIVFE